MRVALFNTMSPFVCGGAELLVEDLRDELSKRGHDAFLFRLPFPNDFFSSDKLFSAVLASKLLDFSEYDCVIAFKFPAFYVVHSNKVLWLFHQFRQVYEMYGQEYGFHDDLTGKAVREIISGNDNINILGAKHVFTNAYECSNRLKKYNGIDSIVLNPPLKDWEKYHFKSLGDYIYYPARFSRLKRQHLAVEAMKYTQTDVRLIIDGVCPEPEYDREIKTTIKENRLESKVIYKNAWISDDDKIRGYSECLAALYIAYKEDSCGFGTMESFYSSKPVISCTDSGGTYELIEHDKSGLFVEPTPECLAKAMDELYNNREKTLEMGLNARREIMRRNINWDETIRKLLS